MTIPRENALAFFPRTVRAGNVELRPLTLAGAVALADIGVEIGEPVPRDLLFKCAWILAETHLDFRAFLRRSRVGLKELSNAVETVFNDAFETFVKPAKNQCAPKNATPSGLGWPLELAEFLCAEYGWSFDAAIHMPVATVHAIYAAARQRHGVRSGFDYFEKAYIKSLKAKANG